MNKNWLMTMCLAGVLAACSSGSAPHNRQNQDSKAQFQQGLALWEKQDYAQALPLMQSAANSGNAVAGRYVGLIYLHGYGNTVQSPMNAFLAFDKAANLGDASAQYWLGYLYEQGIGTTKDAQLALTYYRQAAQQGNAEAKQALARLRTKANP